MLKKRYAKFKDYNDDMKFLRLVFEVENIEELEKFVEIISLHRNRLRGLRIKDTVILNNKIDYIKTKINYYSIIISDEKNITEVLSRISKKNVFIEFLIDIDLVDDNFRYDNIRNLNRVVYVFNNKNQMKKLETVINESIVNRVFPFTMGVPFCLGKPDHMVELFERDTENNYENKEECIGCDFEEFCIMNKEKYDLKKVCGKKKSVINFLKQNEGTINRI